MRGEHDAGAGGAQAADLAEQPFHFAFHEGGGGFVQKQDARRVADGAHDFHRLALGQRDILDQRARIDMPHPEAFQ